MSGYGWVKLLHLSSAVMSFVLFFVRGLWMLQASQRLQQKWLRIVPHVIDTVLLASAITLVIMSRQYPGYEGWLSAKVIALFIYIGLGSLALKYGRNRRIRGLAWVAAMLVFAYIVTVALTRQPAMSLALF